MWILFFNTTMPTYEIYSLSHNTTMTNYEIEILQKLYANIAVSIPDPVYAHLYALGLLSDAGITAAGRTVLKVWQRYLQVDYYLLEFPETANAFQLAVYQDWGLLTGNYLTPAGRLVLEGE